jgi:diguanylate cyclase (GGDEF)-like protein
MALWPLLLLVSATMYVVLSLFVSRQRTSAANAITFMLCSVAIWLVGSSIEHLASGLRGYLVGTTIQYAGIVAVPVAFLAFFRAFGGKQLSRKQLALLCTVPVITLALVATNSLHELMWQHPPVRWEDGRKIISVVWGPWFVWVHVPYCYGVLLIGLGLVAYDLVEGSELYRKQFGAFLLGALIPFAANAFYLLRGGPDTTPLAWGVSALIFTWAVFGLRLFSLNPLAYRVVFETMEDAVLVVNPDGQVIEVNPRARRTLSLPSGHGWWAVNYLPPELGRALGGAEGPAHAQLDTQEIKLDNRYYETRVRLLFDGSGALQGGVLIARDVTARRLAEEHLRENEELLRSVVEHSPDGMLRMRSVHDEDDRVIDFECVVANPAAAHLFGTTPSQMIGRVLSLTGLAGSPALMDAFRKCLDTGEPMEFLTPGGEDGRGGVYRVSVVRVGDELSVTFVDVTEQTRREADMTYAARNDSLTTVLNRRGFEAEMFKRRTPDGVFTGSLLYMDLNLFKQVNDQHGHDAGDAVLKEFATRLKSSVREGDLVARLGGDEFAVFLPDAGQEVAERLAQRIGNLAGEPVCFGKLELLCPASIGIAVSHGDLGLETMMGAADQAMYRAKQSRQGFTIATADDLIGAMHPVEDAPSGASEPLPQNLGSNGLDQVQVEAGG